ncbi:hypothetical protein [Saccharomonospora azurea]|uniref:hypothetical protein n=1 Tax=Saccharomonospora azurea TaxID=40988 RepID=UPI00022DE9F3|nr:hypothetical protein [Saccharomonospora azurea]EHK87689.1 hypothetical protein SZMC14600_08914 [Saccharomonospora azurea SZMC 14600]
MSEQAPVGSTGGYRRLAYARLDVFADYNSFTIRDPAVEFEPGDDFTDDSSPMSSPSTTAASVSARPAA